MPQTKQSLSRKSKNPTMCSSPFKFYMSPIGLHSTMIMLYFLYFVFVYIYSYIVEQEDKYLICNLIFWTLNSWTIISEISKFTDKGRKYFSVSSIPDILDMMIAAIWMVLCFLNVMFRGTDYTINEDIDALFDPDYILISNHSKTFSMLFSIQLFLLFVRFLTLSTNIQSCLTRIIVIILKFLVICVLVFCSWIFGIYFLFETDQIMLVKNEYIRDLLSIFTFIFYGESYGSEDIMSSIFIIIFMIFGTLILINLVCTDIANNLFI